MSGRRVLNATIAVIPFLVVALAVASIVYGLVRFLRGDETLVAVAWAIVAPLLLVPAGLGVQVLLVRLVTRHHGSAEYEAEDESSFL